MKRSVIITGDGSSSLKIDSWDEPYHSRHGALQESRHVFIQEGLSSMDSPDIAILELGFGTGLNALLSYEFAIKNSKKIKYYGVEPYPLTRSEVAEMNFTDQLANRELERIYTLLHEAETDTWMAFDPFFLFKRVEILFEELKENLSFDLIYHDAFSPNVQPELWNENIFKKSYSLLRSGGILVTYSAKGAVRRTMESVGFEVERIPGPPGKREMIRARKL